MKKRITALVLLVALVVTFSFILAACDKKKETVESFTVTNSELDTVMSALSGATNYRALIEETYKQTDKTITRDLSITLAGTDSQLDKNIGGDIVVNDGEYKKYVFAAGFMLTSTTPQLRTAELDKDGIVLARTQSSILDDAEMSLQDIIAECGISDPSNLIMTINNPVGGAYDAALTGQRFKKGGNLVKTEYTIDFSYTVIGQEENGTATVTVSPDGKIAQIVIDKHDLKIKADYTYDIANLIIPTIPEWREAYPFPE